MSREYWVVRVNGGWLQGGLDGMTPNKNKRFKYNRQAAYSNAGSWEDGRVVRVRVKKKAAPELKVGDEVLVRARVKESQIDGMTHLDVNGYFVWVPTPFVSRPTKEPR